MLCLRGHKLTETLFFGFVSTYINLCAGCHCKGDFWPDGIDVFNGVLPACSSKTLGSKFCVACDCSVKQLAN